MSADPDRVEAVKTIQSPTDIHGVRRLMGMVNQQAKFHHRCLRYLLQSGNFSAKRILLSNGKAQQGAFEKIKTLLTSSEILALYDRDK